MTVTSSAAALFSSFTSPLPSAVDIAYSAVSTIMAGLDRFVAYPPVERRVGDFVLDFGVGTQPDHWLTRIPESLIRMGRVLANPERFFDDVPLSAFEKREYVARHLAFSAMIAPLVGGFLYSANPSGVRLAPADLRVMKDRYFSLLEQDAANADRVYPRSILRVAYGDLDIHEVEAANSRMRRQMMDAIRRQDGYVAESPYADVSKWPSYFRNRYHWRDWFDPDSALSWDLMTELLFVGSYGRMQRSAIPPTLASIAPIRSRRPIVVELGAGTGAFAAYLFETLHWRRHPGIDLGFVEMSPTNMALARRRLSPWKDRITFHDYEHDAAAAENIPCEDSSVDTVVAINLFHELPPHIRRQSAQEIGRVLRRGGHLVFFDSVQKGDGVDSLLTAFGESGHHKEKRTGTFHEPYIPGYAEENLDELFGSVGMRRAGGVTYAYLAKGLIFERA